MTRLPASRLRLPTPVRVALCTALLVAGLAASLSCVAVATPFRAAAPVSAADPTARGSGGDTVVIAVTQAWLNRRGRAAFFEHTGLVLDGIAEQEGYLGHSIRRRLWGHEAWTMTVWRDEAALDRFVRSERHRNAMRAGMPGLRAAKFLRLDWPRDEAPPSWARALHELESVEAVAYTDPRAPSPPPGTMAR